MIEPLLPTRQQNKIRFPQFILLAVASLFCIFAYQQIEAAISSAQGIFFTNSFQYFSACDSVDFLSGTLRKFSRFRIF